MDIKTSGGPVRPVEITNPEGNKWQWEGMTLFDYYVGQFIITGMAPLSAINNAARVMELRNKHLIGESK